MTQEEYDKLTLENPNVGLVRPFWTGENYQKELWKKMDITVLICQRNTKHLTQLCLESLLKFYPDIPVLVVDGKSTDDSIVYLRYKSALYPNVKLWERPQEKEGNNSHGVTMDEAIRDHIDTKYVLLMDSDIITMRGGWIEQMLAKYKNKNLYSIGSLMFVTRKGDACNAPEDSTDILRYAHPACSIIKRSMYLEMKPFTDHGAPCVYNMKDAEIKGYDVINFPVDKYTIHLSGGSWTLPYRTIWSYDNEVIVRPLITFIASDYEDIQMLDCQTLHDFDIVTQGNLSRGDLIIHDGKTGFTINNYLYDIRFNVIGEYVCNLNGSEVIENFVREFAELVVKYPEVEKLTLDGVELIKRKTWQNQNALR
jgi:glycosyltransferase involved in cell wall biosynthesis